MQHRKSHVNCPCDKHIQTETMCYKYGSDPPKIQEQDGTRREAPDPTFSIEKPTRDQNPIAYFKLKDPIERKKKAVLSFVQSNDDGGELFIRTVEFDREVAHEEDSEQEKDFIDICSLLHLFVYHEVHATCTKGPSSPKEKSEFLLDPSELLDFAIEDTRRGTKVIRALGLGVSNIDRDALVNKEYESRIFALFIAGELLIRINSTRLQRTQVAISELLEFGGASEIVKTTFGNMRLAASVDQSQILNDKVLLASVETGIKPHPSSTVSLGLDNINFVVTGGHEIHGIVLLYEHVPRLLKRCGFYNPDPSLSLDRNTLSFEELRDVFQVEFAASNADAEAGDMDIAFAKQILETKRADVRTLTMYTFQIIQSSISFDRPSLCDCLRMEQSNKYNWKSQLKKNLGVDIDVPEVDEDGMDKNPTLFDRNKAVLDAPLHIDPNSKECVRKFATYAATIHRKSMDTPYDAEETGGEEPVQRIMTAIVVDGSPLVEFYRIIDEAHRNGDTTFDHVKFFAGGFHTSLAYHRARGLLFCDILLMSMEEYATKEARQKWLLLPNDPRDIESTLIEHTLAVNAAAVDCFKVAHPGVPCTERAVDDHMLACAEANPLAMGVLLELRYATVHFMLRDSEKMGPLGVQQFLSCLRLMLPLFAASHAINYVRIVIETLEWYELASPAERVLFENFYYSKLTPHGKSIWTDRAMEWTIGYLRGFLGRRAQKNQKSRLSRHCACLPRRMKKKHSRQSTAAATSGPWNEQKMSYSEVYVKTYLKMRDLMIWELIGNDNPNENQALTIPEKGPINSALLRVTSIGVDRSIKYYVEHHIQNRHSQTRSEKKVSLRRIPSSAEARQGNKSNEIIARTSIDLGKLLALKKRLTIPRIKEELAWLRTIYDEEIPSDAELNTMRRHVLIYTLCHYRSQYYEDFPGMHKSLVELVESEYEMGTLSNAPERTTELVLPLFRLDEATKASFDT